MLSRRCKSSPGQRLAPSRVAKPAGGRRQTSEAGWSKSAGSVSSLESCVQVVVPQGITTPGHLSRGRGNRGQSQCAGTQYRLCRLRRDRAEATGGVGQSMLGKGKNGD